MTYFRTPHGGSVFAVGSIAWSGSLLTEHDDPTTSRITENVIRHFTQQPSPSRTA